MATLTENVARVTTALENIKNAIIGKGVTPSGKCETFADAIASIPSGGGGDTVAGYFTTSMSGTRINLPFEPKYIMVNSAMGSTLAGSDVCVINGDYYKGYQIASTAMTSKSSATDKSARFTIDATGFTFKATATAYAGKTAYFVASKDVAEDKGE